MSPMGLCRCVEIVRVYLRAHPPDDYRREPYWYATTLPNDGELVRMVPGSCDIARDGDDLVSILMAVPCDDHGIVEPSNMFAYEQLADREFQEFCGVASLIRADGVAEATSAAAGGAHRSTV